MFVCEVRDLEFWVEALEASFTPVCVHGNTLAAGNWLHARLPFRGKSEEREHCVAQGAACELTLARSTAEGQRRHGQRG